ncbi:hypothetical protein CcaverHIS002_0306310 [Cutaneotrichosporon cavernicola]|nr:hypothetical protein CcaverHIS002_0306310 [Cutaneotrichosporon cavernicola]
MEGSGTTGPHGRSGTSTPPATGGRKGPPVFVLAESSYDDLGRSVLDGFGVDVEEGLKENKVGDDGAAVADWYRSLSASARASPAPTEDPDHKASGPARTYARPSTPAAAPSAPIRVHRSEWFIRRALASAPKHPTPKPSTASIGSMLNIDTAKPAPPPIPRYVLGPEDVGFSRLAALGWAGGGLGRPEGWTEDEVTAQAPRPSPETGVVDLTADSEDSEDEQDEEEIKHGPGRTAPIATALKFNRLGLGRIPAEKASVAFLCRD